MAGPSIVLSSADICTLWRVQCRSAATRRDMLALFGIPN